jgi:hypothetical protein
VVALYAFNFTMVAIELVLWFRYREPARLAGVRSERGDELPARSDAEAAEQARDLVRDGPHGPTAPARDPVVRARREDLREHLALGFRALRERLRGGPRDDDDDEVDGVRAELVERRAGGR